MSLTPQTPNFSQSMESAKSFWKTKQGTFGMKVLLGGLAVVGVVVAFNLAAILHFFGNIVWAGANLLIGSAVVTILSSPIWCPSVRFLIRNAFQLSMRWSYRKLVAKDPIGILLNNRDNMRDELKGLDSGVQELAGSKQGLENDIQAQMDIIRDSMDKATAVGRKILSTQGGLASLTGNARMTAGLELQSLGYNKQLSEQAAGTAKKTIERLKGILKETDDMYEDMSRLRNLADFKVQSLTMQADMYAKERKSLLAGQKGLFSASRIMNGDPHQLELQDMAIEVLNDDAANTIGMMKNFNRNMDKYLTNQDIENDARGESGRRLFDELEKKLTLPPESIVGVGGAMPTVTDEGVVIPSDNDYMKFLK